MPVICEYEASKDRETVEVRASTETDTVIGAVVCCEEPNCLSKAVSGVPKDVGRYGNLLELWLAWTEGEQDSVHKVAERVESSEEEEVHLSAERLLKEILKIVI